MCSVITAASCQPDRPGIESKYLSCWLILANEKAFEEMKPKGAVWVGVEQVKMKDQNQIVTGRGVMLRGWKENDK